MGTIDVPVNTETAGGSRYSYGKPRGAWYLPVLGLRLVQWAAMFGAGKYGPADWKKGQSFSTLMDCTWSHTVKLMQYGPWARDEDSGEYHAAHAAWNLLALLTFMVEERVDLDDVTGYCGVSAAELRRAERISQVEDIPLVDVLRRGELVDEVSFRNAEARRPGVRRVDGRGVQGGCAGMTRSRREFLAGIVIVGVVLVALSACATYITGLF